MARTRKFAPTLQHLKRRLRRRIADVFDLDSPANASPKTAFFSQQPTCQIPTLYHLLQKFLGETENGYYVEVGAYDGVFASNTWGLAQRGWYGLLVEPVPHFAEQCRKNYGDRERVEVAQVAVGESNSEIILELAGTLTTANRELLTEYAAVDWAKNSLTSKRVSVACRRLNDVLIEYSVPKGFDLLVVDVEGFEGEVFTGLDLNTWKPKMMIVELADTHPDLTSTAYKDALLGRALVEAGYVITYKDSINTVLVRHDVWEKAFDLS